MSPSADRTVVVAASLCTMSVRSASPVMPPVPTVETTASVSITRSVPAFKSIDPLPPVAVTLAEMVRWSSSPPSLVAVSVMSPPSLSTTGAPASTVNGLEAVRVMLSAPLLSSAVSWIVAPERPSTIPTCRAPVLDRAMSPESVVAATVRVVAAGSETVSSGSASVPIPVSARNAAVAAVRSPPSSSPPSRMAPLVEVSCASVVVSSAPTVMSPTASMSISPDPASTMEPLVIRIPPVPAEMDTVPATPIRSPSAPISTSLSPVIVIVPPPSTAPLMIVWAAPGALAPFCTRMSPPACNCAVLPSEAISTLSVAPPVMNRSDPESVAASAESTAPSVAIWTPPIPSGVASESAVNVMSLPAPVVVSVAAEVPPTMMSRADTRVMESLLVRSESMNRSAAPAAAPFSVTFPPAAVSAALMSTAPDNEMPPPVPDSVVIGESTVIVPPVALIVTSPPVPGSPV